MNMFDNIPNYIQLTISNYYNVACGTTALPDTSTSIRIRYRTISLGRKAITSSDSASTDGKSSSTPPTTSSQTARLPLAARLPETDWRT